MSKKNIFFSLLVYFTVILFVFITTAEPKGEEAMEKKHETIEDIKPFIKPSGGQLEKLVGYAPQIKFKDAESAMKFYAAAFENNFRSTAEKNYIIEVCIAEECFAFTPEGWVYSDTGKKEKE